MAVGPCGGNLRAQLALYRAAIAKVLATGKDKFAIRDVTTLMSSTHRTEAGRERALHVLRTEYAHSVRLEQTARGGWVCHRTTTAPQL